MEELFYPADGTYVPFPGVFATWLSPHGDVPNPCIKYHVSSDIACAGRLAAIALPILREMGLHHKVVQSRSKLVRLQSGKQAGKFITIYSPLHQVQDDLVRRLGGALANAADLHPSPMLPRSRRYSHVFAERPLDEGMFIYGGYETDPSE